MLILNNLMTVIGYSVVSIVGFFIIMSKYYDICVGINKLNKKHKKQKQLKERKEKLFRNNKVA